MKKIKLLTIGLSLVLGASSCTTITKTSTAIPVDAKVYALTVADVNVKPERVSRSASWSFNPFSSTSLGTRKTNLVAETVEAEGCDILLEPEYQVSKTFLGLGGGTVTVTGYPAKFTNFHNPTPGELDAIKVVNEIKKTKAHKFLFF